MVQAMAAAGAAQGLLKNRAVQVLLVGGGILTIWVLYKVVRSVMENLQIVDTAEERAAKAGSMNIETDNKLKPGYWKTLSENQQKKITDKAQFLTTIANDLYKAIHDYYGMEDEEAVLGAVKSVNSKAEWSWVANLYYNKSKYDLWTDVKKALDSSNEKDINEAIRHITNLKNT